MKSQSQFLIFTGYINVPNFNTLNLIWVRCLCDLYLKKYRVEKLLTLISLFLLLGVSLIDLLVTFERISLSNLIFFLEKWLSCLSLFLCLRVLVYLYYKTKNNFISGQLTLRFLKIDKYISLFFCIHSLLLIKPGVRQAKAIISRVKPKTNTLKRPIALTSTQSHTILKR